MNSLLTAVIVNRNSGNAAALRAAALAQEPSVGEVLIADDCSDDGSAERAAAAVPGARVIRTPERQGPGVARNLALRAASRDLLLFTDADAQPEPGAPALLAAALLSAGAAAACPVVLAGSSGLSQYGPGRCHLLGVADFSDVFSATPGGERGGNYSSFSSCCFLLDRRRLPAGLEFDPAYFFYCEDTDFSLRLALGGGRIVYEPRARVRHLKPGLSPERAGLGGDRMFYHSRNRRLTVLKNFPLRAVLPALPLHALYEIYSLLLAARRGCLGRYLSGWFSFLRLAPAALRARSSRAAPLRDLLSLGPLPARPAFRRGAGAAAAAFFDACCAVSRPLARRCL